MRRVMDCWRRGVVCAIVLYTGTMTFADDTFDLLVSAKKYREAIDYADIKIDPSQRNAELWVKLGEAYEQLNMTEKSLASYLVSWRINQGDYKSLLGAARAYNKLENSDMALEMAKKALDVSFTAEASWEYARACIALKRSIEAKKALAKVTENDSSNSIAAQELSVIYISEKSWSQAVPLLKRLYAKNTTGELAFQIGKAYSELGVPDSALLYLGFARTSKHASTEVALLLGRALYSKKRWGDCLGMYRSIAQDLLEATDYYRFGCAVEKIEGNTAAFDLFVKAVEKFSLQNITKESLYASEKVARFKISKQLFDDALELLKFIVSSDPNEKTVAQSHLLLAEVYQGKGDNSNAISSLEQAIAINSRNIEAYAQLADLYQKIGQAEKARKTFEVMLGINPNDPGIYLALGQYAFKNSRYEDALMHFEKSKSLKGSAQAQEGIARSAFQLNQTERAFTAAEAAIVADSKLRDARMIFAAILVKRQKFTGAQEQYERLLVADSDNLELLEALAICYLNNKKTEHLYKIDTRIAQLKSGDVACRHRLANYCLSKNRQDDAVNYFREIVHISPSDTLALRHIAQLARKRGDFDEALRMYQQYIALQPNDAESQRDLGDVLYEKKDLSGALAAYKTALRLDPGIKGFHKRYADIVIARGEEDEVIRALSGVIDAKGADLGTYMTLGLIYQQKHDLRNAIEMYQNALRMSPSHFEALAALASCQADNGAIRDAIITYEQAVMLNPTSFVEFKALGDLYAKELREEEALKMYRKYLAKDSSDAALAAKVGRILYDQKNVAEAYRFYSFAERNLEPEDAVRYASACISLNKSRSAIAVLLPLKADRTIQGDLQTSTYRLLANAYENDSGFAAASAAYGDYLGLRGVDDGDAAFKQAAYLEKDDPVGAQKIFELNCKKYPNDYRNFLYCAKLYSDRKDMIEKAIPLFKRVTELADSIPSVWLELGKIYGKLGNDSEELTAYRKYVQFDPQHTEANRRIGILLMRKGETNEGVVFLEIANTLQPEDTEIMTILAGGYVRTNRYNEAIALLNKAKSRKSEDPDIRFQLFELYQKNGHKEKAEKEMHELVQMKREPRFLMLYAEALIMQEKLIEADSTIEELLGIDPENLTVLLLKAKVMRLQKQYDEAVEVYKETSVIYPEAAQPLFERAETHLEQSKPQWAETFYKRALRADPALARAELGLAKIAKIRKDMQLYREHLENARKLGPDDEFVTEELRRAGY